MALACKVVVALFVVSFMVFSHCQVDDEQQNWSEPLASEFGIAKPTLTVSEFNFDKFYRAE